MLHLNITQQLGTFSLNLNVDIPPHGVTAIFGKSGAGKSSLINLVAGLSKPEQGRICLNGRILFDSQAGINLPPEKRRVGYVFQEHRLFPHYTVEKNLKYGCKRSDSAKFLQIVELLGIGHLLERFPNSLSGGEKQRVAIGRALLAEPDILLMDEPLSALDLPRKQELLDYLSKLAKQVEIPILYVSHSLDEIVKLADNLLMLEQGNVLAFGKTSEVWQSEAFAQWQRAMPRLSLLECEVAAEQAESGVLLLQLGQQKLWWELPTPTLGGTLSKTVRFMLAENSVQLTLNPPSQSATRNVLYGTIGKISPENHRLQLEIDVENQRIWTSISHWAFQKLGLTQGQKVYLQIHSISL